MVFYECDNVWSSYETEFLCGKGACECAHVVRAKILVVESFDSVEMSDFLIS